LARFEDFDADGAVRYEVTGRLDSAGVAEIELPLTASLARGSDNVLLDLAKVPFVGSLGIRLLIASARTLKRQGRTMVLIGVQPQVMEIFETVDLADMIPIAANGDEAAQLLAG
jgi:anti-anti-sigma factor